MLSCDRIESAKFIHGTPSPTKLVYYPWDYLTVCEEMISNSSKNIAYKPFAYKSYI